MPDFDDFDGENDTSSMSLQPNSAAGGGGGSNLAGASSGIGPTLSAPPSPALSSYSDHHSPSAMNANNDPLYELKTKRRGMNGSNSSFPSFNNNNQRTGRTSSYTSCHKQDQYSTRTAYPLPSRLLPQSLPQ